MKEQEIEEMMRGELERQNAKMKQGIIIALLHIERQRFKTAIEVLMRALPEDDRDLITWDKG